MDYEANIGLEVHVQLKTRTKMFTRAEYAFGRPPNTCTNEVVMALPGVLPVMNREAVMKSVQVGLMFGCEIARFAKWDRKNYFYPDSPKNYQISQYDQPLCRGGGVELEMQGASRNVEGEHKFVRFDRIHLEEDAGKLTHGANDTLCDYNRAGMCLLEMVTEPDLKSSEEAVAFLNALRANMVAGGFSDCDMEKGQMRADVNVSVRPVGSEKLGTKVEIKNMNSVSGIKAAIEYEVRRQTRALEKGAPIAQETRGWDDLKQQSFSQRSKEEAHDYRYFPDPDLMPVVLSEEEIEAQRVHVPEKVLDRQRRFQEQYKLPYTITSVLCWDRPLADFFEEAVKARPQSAQQIANYVANDLLRELSGGAAEGEGRLPLTACRIAPAHIAGLVALIDEGKISKQIGKEVFVKMFATGEDPSKIVETEGLEQSSDSGELEALCQQVISENPKPAAEFREGNEKAINALKGRVMKATQGKANPQVIDEVLRRLLS